MKNLVYSWLDRNRLSQYDLADLTGIKPTARLYNTTPSTIRKWIKRYEENNKIDFKDKSKKDLREYKKKYKAFEKIQIDVKYLDDIPEMYKEYIQYKLPKYQFTARCIRTGALFISYADEKTISYSVIFLTQILEHLKKHNIKLKGYRIQTDNGREFTNGFNQKVSDFTKIIENICDMKHRLFPPAQKHGRVMSKVRID